MQEGNFPHLEPIEMRPVWAVPPADLGALIVAVIMFVPHIKKLQNTLY